MKEIARDAPCVQCLNFDEITQSCQITKIDADETTCLFLKDSFKKNETKEFDFCQRQNCKFNSCGECQILEFTENGNNCSFFKERKTALVDEYYSNAQTQKRLLALINEPNGLRIWVQLLEANPHLEEFKVYAPIIKKVKDYKRRYTASATPKVYNTLPEKNHFWD